MAPVLEVEDLRMYFPLSAGAGLGTGVVRAVDGVSLTVAEGEVLAVVGESGSGKTTLGRCVARLLEPTSGVIRLLGTDITHLGARKLRSHRRRLNMVFQDPYSSLDPRMTVGKIVAEPLRLHRVASGEELDRQVAGLFESVRLDPLHRLRYPHELSGGQRQRVAIARALALHPRLLIADEPTSSLDVSSQAAIINLLLDLQRDLGFSVLFITHDLSLAEFFADRVVVMYLGRLAEAAGAMELLKAPKHPYTQALLSAVPVPDVAEQRGRRRIVLGGDVPNPVDPPSGCVFHPRCPVAVPRCSAEVPVLRAVGDSGHLAACHLVADDGTAPDLVDTPAVVRESFLPPGEPG